MPQKCGSLFDDQKTKHQNTRISNKIMSSTTSIPHFSLTEIGALLEERFEHYSRDSTLETSNSVKILTLLAGRFHVKLREHESDVGHSNILL